MNHPKDFNAFSSQEKFIDDSSFIIALEIPKQLEIPFVYTNEIHRKNLFNLVFSIRNSQFYPTKNKRFSTFFLSCIFSQISHCPKTGQQFSNKKKDRKKIKQNAIAPEIIISLQSQMEHFVVGFGSNRIFRMIENKATNIWNWFWQLLCGYDSNQYKYYLKILSAPYQMLSRLNV